MSIAHPYQQMSPVIAFDIAVVAQKVKVQLLYNGRYAKSEKVGCFWVSSRSGWILEKQQQLLCRRLHQPDSLQSSWLNSSMSVSEWIRTSNDRTRGRKKHKIFTMVIFIEIKTLKAWNICNVQSWLRWKHSKWINCLTVCGLRRKDVKYKWVLGLFMRLLAICKPLDLNLKVWSR